ncbi:MAG: succinyl-CoA synthetase subunit alpha, partial [Rhodobacteraceae bacterium]|nr:succinyl-CoA synthetase subunit alpha [Paracoccaceae bacterium]
MITIARLNGTQIIGPNTAGMVTPGEAFAGIMPGFNNKVFKEGSIGVISRSGSLGTLVCLNLVQSGFGQSTFYGIGGDPIIGTDTREALKHLYEDEKTKAIVICGEIGGMAEEEASEFARTIDKPVVAFIAGKSSPEGKKMGHAGAIVSGNSGSYKAKRSYLEKNGIQVADIPSQVPGLLKSNDELRLQ